jgi:type I restriction enzyme S subunit
MEWKEVRLGDVVEIVNGFAFKSKAFTLEGIPVIKIKNIKAGKVILNDLDYISTSDINPKYTKIRSSDILITMTGNRMDGSPETWVGKVSLFRHQGDFYLNQRVSALRLIDDSVDNNFLSYYLSSWQSQLYFALNSNSSGGQANITPAVVQEYRLMVPELETQRSIASILSSLDRKIELNNKINADLEEMAQAIFKNWFVDFEPFKDGKFVDSELGKIPEGWKVGRLTDIIKLMPGGTPKTSEPLYWDNGTIPFFSPKDVNGVYCFATEKHITETGLNKCSSNLYPKDTIFITCRGTVGKVCLAACDMAMNQSNYAIRAIDGYSQYYVFFLVKSVVERLIKKSNGAVFSAITSKDFDEEILIPSQKAVEDFTNVINGFFRRIFTIGTENSRLSLLRDTLLPRLMSGELEVPE